MSGLLLLLCFDQRITHVKAFVTGAALHRSDAEVGHQPVETFAVCTKSSVTFAARAEKVGGSIVSDDRSSF